MLEFFSQLPGRKKHGSTSDLEAEQQHFRIEQVSGIVEAQTEPSNRLIVVFARGVLAGAYILKSGESAPVILREILESWRGIPIAIRSLTVPDTVARLLWQLLDSQPLAPMEIRDEERWQDWLTACQDRQISVLVEIKSTQSSGLVYISMGQIVEAESVYLQDGEFHTGCPYQNVSPPLELHMYEPNHQAQSWQCLYLRSGAGKWLQHILNASLMSIGEQMDLVIGHRLTQRLLHQTFECIPPAERNILESRRLVPAAFVG